MFGMEPHVEVGEPLVFWDRNSFDDSDRFDADSICTWSDQESICNNWRGWKKSSATLATSSVRINSSRSTHTKSKLCKGGEILPLVELAAHKIACTIPFGIVEKFDPPVPIDLQKRIAFWSFPEDEEDIRLYACLANGNAEEYQRAETLIKQKCVREMLQIGFHLSATISQSVTNVSGAHKVAITFDRQRITSCSCTCHSQVLWCQHIVAVCLSRITQPHRVCLREPVSESLLRLERNQLQKFAQYLINEFPQQILPTAQKLLDELLNQGSIINETPGAPDPTAGATASELTSWCLDRSQLHNDIKKILTKQCTNQSTVFSDVNHLNSTAPPAASEYSQLLRPLRGREPEGLWNLLSIVREMLRKRDHNSIPLLEVITEELLACEQIIIWWFETKVSLHSGLTNQSMRNNCSCTNQHACSSLCDEVVVLWRLAALDPNLSTNERQILFKKLYEWHLRILERFNKVGQVNAVDVVGRERTPRRNSLEIFSGFKPALEACLVDWTDRRSLPEESQTDIQVAKQENSTISGPEIQKVLSKAAKKKAKVLRGNNGNNNDTKKHNIQEVSNFDEANYLKKNDDPLPSTSMSTQKEDEFDIYYFHKKTANSEGEGDPSRPENLIKNVGKFVSNVKSDNPKDMIRLNAKKLNDPLEVLFSKAEGLNAHGFTKEACLVSVRLAKEILEKSTCPNLNLDTHLLKRHKRSKKSYIDNQLSLMASDTLNKVAFLCAVLSENQRHRHLAFRIGLYGLELERGPAYTKPLEVKLINQEQDLVCLLKKIPLTSCELSILREKSDQLCQGIYKSKCDALIPLMLAGYIFDAFVLSATTQNRETASSQHQNHNARNIPESSTPEYSGYRQNPPPRQSSISSISSIAESSYCLSLNPHKARSPLLVCDKLPSDEILGFRAAVAAIGYKTNISEAEHPLLCEGTRRLRGELALLLLVHHKDDQSKLNLILDKLLDKDVHKLYKDERTGLSSANEKTDSSDKAAQSSTSFAPDVNVEPKKSILSDFMYGTSIVVPDLELREASPAKHGGGWERHFEPSTFYDNEDTDQDDPTQHSALDCSTCSSEGSLGANRTDVPSTSKSIQCEFSCIAPTMSPHQEPSTSSMSMHVPLPSTLQGAEAKTSDGSVDSLLNNNENTNVDVNELASSLGDMNLDIECSSTTNDVKESDKVQQLSTFKKDSDSNTQSNSSEGSQRDQQPEHIERADASTCNEQDKRPDGSTASSNTYNSASSSRRRRRLNTSSAPNQPSEASAHFMFELAKTVFVKAGGNNASADIFHPTIMGIQSFRSVHRRLHMSALQIALYALGLHNRTSINWMSRTYSSHSSWILAQALDIGLPAIKFLSETWQGHLTPIEAADLGDRASMQRDPEVQRVAAKLALSYLDYAHALTLIEIKKALVQCEEQSSDMLEKACVAIEGATKGGEVSSDILFEVARKWYKMYEETTAALATSRNNTTSIRHRNGTSNSADQFRSLVDHGSASQQNSLVNDSHSRNQMANNRAYTHWAQQHEQPKTSNDSMYPYSRQQTAHGSHPVSNGQECVLYIDARINRPILYNQQMHNVALERPPTMNSSQAGRYCPTATQQAPFHYFRPVCNLDGPRSSNAHSINSSDMIYSRKQGGAQDNYSTHCMMPLMNNSSYYPNLIDPSNLNHPSQTNERHNYLATMMKQHPPYRLTLLQSNSNSTLPAYFSNTPVPATAYATSGYPQWPVSLIFQPATPAPIQNLQGPNHIQNPPYNNYEQLPNQSNHGGHQYNSSIHLQGPFPSNSSSQNYRYPTRDSGLMCDNDARNIIHNAHGLSQHSYISSNDNPRSGNHFSNGQKFQDYQNSTTDPYMADSFSQDLQPILPQLNQQQLSHLQSAFRVGIKAIELINSGQESRNKYQTQDKYKEDVKWLLGVSKLLGPSNIKEFIACAIKNIVDPLILADIVEYISKSESNFTEGHKSVVMPQLVQSCQQAFTPYVQYKMKHFQLTKSSPDSENILKKARPIFEMSGIDGMARYNELKKQIERPRKNFKPNGKPKQNNKM